MKKWQIRTYPSWESIWGGNCSWRHWKQRWYECDLCCSCSARELPPPLPFPRTEGCRTTPLLLLLRALSLSLKPRKQKGIDERERRGGSEWEGVLSSWEAYKGPGTNCETDVEWNAKFRWWECELLNWKKGFKISRGIQFPQISHRFWSDGFVDCINYVFYFFSFPFSASSLFFSILKRGKFTVCTTIQ